MPTRNYWLDLFTFQTWKEFQEAGTSIPGFRESRWNIVQKMEERDLQFFGTLRVQSERT